MQEEIDDLRIQINCFQKKLQKYKLKHEFLSEKGFSCMVDILLKLRRFDPLYGEVPMILRYDQKVGKSKMNVASTIKETLLLIGRYKTNVIKKS